MPTSSDPIIICSIGGRVYSTSADKPIISILTYPTPDLAGDYVRPDGGDWSNYPQHPLVNWAHDIPIGRGSVEIKSLKYNDDITQVAVGTTQFAHNAADLNGIDLRRRDPRTHRSWDKEPPYTIAECLEEAESAERLVRDEVAIGVSIEFETDPNMRDVDWWDLEKKSLLDNRPARHFEKYTALGYAHARIPVNPGCMTVSSSFGQRNLSDKENAALEKAITIAQTGKFPGGRKVSPIILKSFSELKELKGSARIDLKAKGEPRRGTDEIVRDIEIASEGADHTSRYANTYKYKTLHEDASLLHRRAYDLIKNNKHRVSSVFHSLNKDNTGVPVKYLLEHHLAKVKEHNDKVRELTKEGQKSYLQREERAIVSLEDTTVVKGHTNPDDPEKLSKIAEHSTIRANTHNSLETHQSAYDAHKAAYQAHANEYQYLQGGRGNRSRRKVHYDEMTKHLSFMRQHNNSANWVSGNRKVTGTKSLPDTVIKGKSTEKSFSKLLKEHSTAPATPLYKLEEWADHHSMNANRRTSSLEDYKEQNPPSLRSNGRVVLDNIRAAKAHKKAYTAHRLLAHRSLAEEGMSNSRIGSKVREAQNHHLNKMREHSQEAREAARKGNIDLNTFNTKLPTEPKAIRSLGNGLVVKADSLEEGPTDQQNTFHHLWNLRNRANTEFQIARSHSNEAHDSDHDVDHMKAAGSNYHVADLYGELAAHLHVHSQDESLPQQVRNRLEQARDHYGSRANEALHNGFNHANVLTRRLSDTAWEKTHKAKTETEHREAASAHQAEHSLIQARLHQYSNASMWAERRGDEAVVGHFDRLSRSLKDSAEITERRINDHTKSADRIANDKRIRSYMNNASS